MSRTLFPLSKAKGNAFCNRLQERNWLSNNIASGKHSIIIAPRRFGKSSLADKVIMDMNLPAVTLNFNACADSDEVEQVIRRGVGQLINVAIGSVDKLLASLRRYLTHLNPKIIIDGKGAHLELSSENNTPATVKIEESLSMLEKLLKEKKQRAIMVFDEFQMVGLIAKGKGIEAAIRNVIQEADNLTILFSGSHRHLLKIIFEDNSRPLYKLCRKLHLKRIAAKHYREHLAQAAVQQWQAELDKRVINEILFLSERHPFYLNYLCDIVWTNADKVPNLSEVNQAWQQLLEEERSDAQAEIASFSMAQKKVLKFLVHQQAGALLSAHTVKEIGLATSTIAASLKALTEKDVIEKIDDSYQIINPVIKALLK